MYSVTKKIEFCYGHRLLDYDGICKHPHGHNAVAEIEVRSGSLDNRNMVCDFSDIKRIVKGSVRLHAFAGISRCPRHGLGNADFLCHIRRR
jgi:6-pyruvoyl-tetrahydropterin synthase